MDHLEKVHHPVRCPVQVPFVCASFTFNPNALTFEDFERIPHEYGYSTHDLVESIPTQQDLSRKTPFLQSWLFFGLLVQVLGPIGVTLSRNDFIQTQPDGKLVITTGALPKYLWFWLAVRHNQPRQETEDHAKLADSCLQLANRVANKLTSHISSPIVSTTEELRGETLDASSNVEQSAAQRVLRSLVILGETLCYARDQIIRYNFGPPLHWDYPPLGLALLREAGWCIAEINSL